MTHNGCSDAEPPSTETSPDAGGLTRRGVLAAATGVASVAAGGMVIHGSAANAAVAPAAAVPAAAAPVAGKAAAAARTAGHGAPMRGMDIAAEGKDRNREGRFGVMFKQLPAFRPPEPLLRELAEQMGKARDPSGPDVNGDNPTVMAGYTFLGQFIDHDMTLDRTAMNGGDLDAAGVRNFDSPAFDLASVYGRGPAADPQLYESDRTRLKVVRNAYGVEDLPRRSDGTAYIGDHRNDENLIVAQLHLLFLKFHNRCLSDGLAKTFEEARTLTRRHFQWVIVNDFLRRLVGSDVVDRFHKGPRDKPNIQREFYKPRNPTMPMMPVEYAVAAYRFGHSMVRGAYELNAVQGRPRSTPIFSAAQEDLRGSRPLPAHLKLDWWRFYPMNSSSASGGNKARRIDARLAGPLFDLPTVSDAMVSLAERNLIRGRMFGLPSGQQVAKLMGEAVRSNAVLGLPQPGAAGWGGEAPLWFYILREAELAHRGDKLGPVGGRIVAEVILTIMNADKYSYFNAKGWQPKAPIAPATGQFEMKDFCAFAQGYY